MTSLPKILVSMLVLVSVLALACAGGAPNPARITNLSEDEIAKLASWNQERVTAIGEELATSVNDTYVSVNTLSTGGQIGSGQANAQLRLQERLRVAGAQSRLLATQLKDGKDRAETASTYARLMVVLRDARDDARQMFIEEPTLDKIAATTDLLRRIAPYYDPNWNANIGE